VSKCLDPKCVWYEVSGNRQKWQTLRVCLLGSERCRVMTKIIYLNTLATKQNVG